MQGSASNDNLDDTDSPNDTDDPNLPPGEIVSIHSERGKEFLLFALIAMHGGKVTIPLNMMPTDAYTIDVVAADDDTFTMAISSGKVH